LTGTLAAVRVVPHDVTVALALLGFAAVELGELQPVVSANAITTSAMLPTGTVNRPLGMAQSRRTCMAVSSPRA